MKNLINFFFSFDKLMKEKLVIAFFWLAIIFFGLNFFSEALSAIKLGPLAAVVKFINFFGGILLTLVTLRLFCELAVALFRINDNLSPDGGKSENANIDPISEARKAAEAAAIRARELSKTAGEKASAATKSVKDSAEDLAESATSKAKSATMSAKEKTESVMGKGSVASADQDPTPVKILEPSAPKKRGRPAGSTSKAKSTTSKTSPSVKATPKPKVKTTEAPKKRGRPAGSKNKTSTTKAAKPKTTSTGKKRGPKPGSKAPRDSQGRLLKKDGTLRGKPGPKT